MRKRATVLFSILFALAIWNNEAHADASNPSLTSWLLDLNDHFLDLFEGPIVLLTETSSNTGWYTDDGRYTVRQYDDWQKEQLSEDVAHALGFDPSSFYELLKDAPHSLNSETNTRFSISANTIAASARAMALRLSSVLNPESNLGPLGEREYWFARTSSNLGLVGYCLFELELVKAISQTEKAESWYTDMLLAGALDATISSLHAHLALYSLLFGQESDAAANFLETAKTSNESAESHLRELNYFLQNHAPEALSEPKSSRKINRERWTSSNIKRLQNFDNDLISDVAYARNQLEKAIAANMRTIALLDKPDLDLSESSPIWIREEGQSVLNDSTSYRYPFVSLMGGVLGVILYDL